MAKNEKQVQPFKEGQRFNPYGIFKGIYIPDCIAKTKLLTPVEKLVWGRLCKHAGGDGLCYPSFTKIAGALGISRSGAIKSVASLVSKGFLEKHSQAGTSFEGPRKRTNRYTFIWHPCLNDGLKFTGQLSESVNEKSSPSGGLSEPSLVYRVDSSSSQSRLKEIHKENQEKTTTTTMPVEGGLSPLEASGGCGSSLSDEQLRYIQLQVEYTAAHGDLRKPPRRLERALMRLAEAGKLDMSDFEDLKKWKVAQATPRSRSGSPTVPDKEALLAEVAAKNREALQWLNSLAPTHPAKCDKRPSNMPKDLWIRHQYQKYTQSEEMNNVA